jgi:hypothetical protein
VVVEVVVGGWDLLGHAEAQNRQAAAEYVPWIADLIGPMPAWMVTITHQKVDTHRLFSQRIRRQWLHKLNRDLFGGNYERHGEGLLSFFSFEYQWRGTIHQHGIVAGEALLQVSRAKQKSHLQAAARGWCDISLPRSTTDKAVRYCAKYITKEGDFDWWVPRSMTVNGGVSIAAGTSGVQGDSW